ncbi:MAG: hypothetical protein JWR75_688 [Devosia sp.]|nr:hypothetical protein [Devosia sp.]
MLRACAFVVGADHGPGATLLEIVRGLGFASTSRFSTLAAADHHTQHSPLAFFLFSAVEDVETLRPIAEAVRAHPARKLQFSPLIYFSHSPSLDTIRHCINMGFDDVITLPFSQARVQERIQRQIGQPLAYFETSSYFGPDRRTRLGAGERGAGGGGSYRRFEILRQPTGISILSDESYTPPAPVEADNALEPSYYL